MGGFQRRSSGLCSVEPWGIICFINSIAAEYVSVFWLSVRLRTQHRGYIDAVLALIVWLVDKKSFNNRKAFAMVPGMDRILMIVTCSSFFPLDLRFGASR